TTEFTRFPGGATADTEAEVLIREAWRIFLDRPEGSARAALADASGWSGPRTTKAIPYQILLGIHVINRLSAHRGPLDTEPPSPCSLVFSPRVRQKGQCPPPEAAPGPPLIPPPRLPLAALLLTLAAGAAPAQEKTAPAPDAKQPERARTVEELAKAARASVVVIRVTGR